MCRSLFVVEKDRFLASSEGRGRAIQQMCRRAVHPSRDRKGVVFSNRSLTVAAPLNIAVGKIGQAGEGGQTGNEEAPAGKLTEDTEIVIAL